jgi:hypothetical protein
MKESGPVHLKNLLARSSVSCVGPLIVLGTFSEGKSGVNAGESGKKFRLCLFIVPFESPFQLLSKIKRCLSLSLISPAKVTAQTNGGHPFVVVSLDQDGGSPPVEAEGRPIKEVGPCLSKARGRNRFKHAFHAEKCDSNHIPCDHSCRHCAGTMPTRTSPCKTPSPSSPT